MRTVFKHDERTGIERLIIDLRDNGGGYLDALVSVSSLSLPEDTLTG